MADRIITHALAADASSITFKVKDAGEFTFTLAEASEANRRRAEVHGWVQRISDAAALDKGSTNQAKLDAMKALAEHYAGGDVDWNRKGGGGARPFDMGLLVTALAQTKCNGDIDKTNAAIDGVAAKRGIGREEAGKLFAADADVAAAMARIKATRNPPKFDADAELAAMMTTPAAE